MSDTSKATPRPWQRQPAELDGAGYVVHFRALSKIGKVPVYPCAVGGSTKEEAEANADFIDLLINSHNPDRDKLAQDLAEIVSTNAIVGSKESELAARLLALYEE